MKEELAERLAFLAFDATDRALLAALEPILERQADRLVSAFYRHLLSFDRTRELLADPDVKDRLLRKQREYLVSLARPEHDDRYLEERVAIGEVHERIGLEPRWYLGAYSLYFSLLAPVIAHAQRGDPERATRTLTALVKTLMLDAQLAVSAYMQRHDRELEHLNRELAASTRSLAIEYQATESELRQTERRAQAAESLASVATLVAGLAHEIGTPMGVIRGHAEGLESDVTGERAQWRLRIIREQVDRISSIIQALLNIARPREQVRAPVELAGVAQTALTFLSEKLERRGIEVVRDFVPVPAVRGDADKLQQLFLNLLLNAIDALPEGGCIEVSIRPDEAEAIEVVVRDGGIGIAEHHLPNVFKPFYTTKPAGHGSGLGLVVAEGIVADHGGRIDVESEVGVGTTFRIHFPADVVQLPASGA